MMRMMTPPPTVYGQRRQRSPAIWPAGQLWPATPALHSDRQVRATPLPLDNSAHSDRFHPPGDRAVSLGCGCSFFRHGPVFRFALLVLAAISDLMSRDQLVVTLLLHLFGLRLRSLLATSLANWLVRRAYNDYFYDDSICHVLEEEEEEEDRGTVLHYSDKT